VHRTAALLLLLGIAACRIDRTPQELIDPMNPAIVDRLDAEREVATHVGAFREALTAGSHADAIAALQPLPDAVVIAAEATQGRARFGEEGIAAALDGVVVPPGTFTRMPDLRVQADTRQRMAWFATHLELFPVTGGGGAPERMRMSGVFLRLEGAWRLAHLHLSRESAPAATLPAPAPDAGAAPPADE
jgi:hypothetical protein